MTKTELAKALHEESEHVGSLWQAKGMVDDFLEILGAGLKEDGEVNLPGFGKFVVKTRAARKGRNPATGEAMDIAEKQVMSFKPGSALKRIIEG